MDSERESERDEMTARVRVKETRRCEIKEGCICFNDFIEII